MQKQVCHVMGTEWTVEVKTKDEDKLLAQGMDGYCDFSNRSIVILDLDSEPAVAIHNKAAYHKLVARHEIVHAYLAECGITDSTMSAEHWGTNEEMVDWFAKMLPKMQATLCEIGAERE